MSYHDFSPEQWEAFQPERAALLRIQLAHAKRTNDARLVHALEATIDAIERKAAFDKLPWWRQRLARWIAGRA